MKKFLVLLMLPLPFLNASMPTYASLQYRNDYLQWTSHQTAEMGLTSKARWQQMQGVECRVATEMPTCWPLSVGIEAGVLLPALSNRFQFLVEEKDVGQLKLKGKKSRVSGGDGSLFFLQRRRLNAHCTWLFSVGYAGQGRHLKTPLCAANTLDSIVDIDNFAYKIHWHGPWIGFGCGYAFSAAWNVFGNAAYQCAIWQGRSSFNTQERFSDQFCMQKVTTLTQKGLLNGFKLICGTAYTLNSCWKALLSAKMEVFDGRNAPEKGQSKLSISNWAGRSIGVSHAKRRKKASLHWHSWAISGTVNYVF